MNFSFSNTANSGVMPTSVIEHSGFPNPATDINIVSLDLPGLLIKHPSSTFFMRTSGNAWEKFGIFDGNLVVVDRALYPQNADLVTWWDGEAFAISRFSRLPEDAIAWGVVTSIVHQYRP
jgi:DNA polymerase V